MGRFFCLFSLVFFLTSGFFVLAWFTFRRNRLFIYFQYYSPEGPRQVSHIERKENVRLHTTQRCSDPPEVLGRGCAIVCLQKGQRIFVTLFPTALTTRPLCFLKSLVPLMTPLIVNLRIPQRLRGCLPPHRQAHLRVYVLQHCGSLLPRIAAQTELWPVLLFPSCAALGFP